MCVCGGVGGKVTILFNKHEGLRRNTTWSFNNVWLSPKKSIHNSGDGIHLGVNR